MSRVVHNQTDCCSEDEYKLKKIINSNFAHKKDSRKDQIKLTDFWCDNEKIFTAFHSFSHKIMSHYIGLLAVSITQGKPKKCSRKRAFEIISYAVTTKGNEISARQRRIPDNTYYTVGPYSKQL